MARRPEDRYANHALIEVDESAAGTLTHIQMLTGVSLGQGIGLLIDEINYHFRTGTIADLVAVGDKVSAGLCSSDGVTSLTGSDRRVLHHMSMDVEPVIGAAASGGTPVVQPFVYKFDPPMIFAGPRLFGSVIGGSLAAVAQVDIRFLFRYIELTDKEYLELAETFVLVG